MNLLVTFFLISGIVFMNDNNLSYDKWFTSNAMRVDYYHVGDCKQESVSIDEIIKEKEWGGTRKNLIDPFDFESIISRFLTKKQKN